MICNITASDIDTDTSLKVYWYNSKGMQLRSNEKRIEIKYSNNSSVGQIYSVLALLISRVKFSDSGDYTCKAFYLNLNTESSTSLTVHSKF